MVKSLLEQVRNASTQARLWAYAAWTLPFVALAIIAFENYIGWDSLITRTITIISVVFFAISVFWWWWALNKIVVLLQAAKRNEENFEEIKQGLRETKDILKENVGNRQRGK